VRGPDRDLQIVADIVAVLETPAGKRAPKVKNLHVFTLKHANPLEVGMAVTQLGIEARVVPSQFAGAFGGGPPPVDDVQARHLFALGTEQQIREVREVVEAMDVPPVSDEAGGAGGPPPAPKKARRPARGQP